MLPTLPLILSLPVLKTTKTPVKTSCVQTNAPAIQALSLQPLAKPQAVVKQAQLARVWKLPPPCGGGRLFLYRKLVSTQTLVLDELQRAAMTTERGTGCFHHGDVILVRRQTAGRGRRARAWLSTPGVSLTMSRLLILPPQQEHHRYAQLASLAVAQGLEQLSGTRARRSLPLSLKWPNDVLCGGRKLAGVLVNASSGQTHNAAATRQLVLGIGVNVMESPAQLAHYNAELPSASAAESEQTRLTTSFFAIFQHRKTLFWQKPRTYPQCLA